MSARGGAKALRLRDLDRCFCGHLPATVATCSPEGTPNITYLSVVHRTDDDHLVLSYQFFNKTRENVLAHPRAQLLVIDPLTMVQYRVNVVYERTEQEGAVFDRMRTNLDAVASQTGMSGVFRLRGADVYRALEIEELAHDLDLSEPEVSADFVSALETLSARLAECEDLDALLDTTLAGLDELFGFPCSMILVSDDAEKRLFTVASRGFPQSGVGAEIAAGEGLIGTALSEKRPVRVTDLLREKIMAEAVRSRAAERGQPLEPAREIRLPGLDGVQSQLAVPILARECALGVLCVQSTEAGRMTPADEKALCTVARHLAISMLLLGSSAGNDVMGRRAYARRPVAGAMLEIRHHASDDSIFIDNEYLIKGVAGRILLRILSVYQRDGRVDFSNKELRVDETLQLGAYRDNLEARLILLRRRLEERTEALRLTKTGRGRMRLELNRAFELVRAP